MNSKLFVVALTAGIFFLPNGPKCRAGEPPRANPPSEVKDAALAPQAQLPSLTAATPSTSNVNAAPSKRSPLKRTKRITFGELPTRAQRTLNALSEGQSVHQIVKGDEGGKTVYEATVQRDGDTFNVRLDENGRLVRDGVSDRLLAALARTRGAAFTPGSAAGRPAESQSATGGGSSEAIPLAHPQKINFDQLPVPVMSALQAQAGALFLEKLEVGHVGEQWVYQATISRQGQPVEIRLTPDGRILDKAGTGTP